MLPALLLLRAAPDVSSPINNALFQYGAVGVIALIFIYIAYALGTRLERAHDKEIARVEAAYKSEIARVEAAYSKEVARGDRIEKELAELNRLISTSLAGELARATDAIREALEIMREQRRH